MIYQNFRALRAQFYLLRRGFGRFAPKQGALHPGWGLCPHEQPYGHLGGDTENDIQKIQKISVTPPKFPMYFGDVILSIPAQMSVRLLCEENSLNSQGGSYIQTNEHTKFTGGDVHIRTYERTDTLKGNIRTYVHTYMQLYVYRCLKCMNVQDV